MDKDNIPSVGGAKGIFEMFVPGAFLLLNLLGSLYFSPYIDQKMKDDITKYGKDLVVSVPIIICFGYLAGMILRLLKCALADDLSAKYIRIVDSGALRDENNWIHRLRVFVRLTWKIELLSSNRKELESIYKTYAIEPFPYIKWIGEDCENYFNNQNALTFYEQTWRQPGNQHGSRQFFNFRKNMLAVKAPGLTGEIYSIEALSRYIASTFYALIISSILIALLVHSLVSSILIVLYFLSILTILRTYRFIRIKEVKAVFALDYALNWEPNVNNTPSDPNYVGRAKEHFPS